MFTAVRTPRYVYAEYSTGERELYDLASDPDELQNLDGNPAYAAVEAELAGRAGGAAATARARRASSRRRSSSTRSPPATAPRSVSVSGADEPHVDEVDFAADGRPAATATARPFELAAPRRPATAKVRALAILDDGRRVTLDLPVHVCQA